MDATDLQALENFSRRFPWQIRATGEVRTKLLQLLCMLDAAVPQRIVRGDGGRPVFRLRELAMALGLSERKALRRAMLSSLVSAHLVWVRFESGRQPQAGLTAGGVVVLSALVPPGRKVSGEQRAWHVRRRKVAIEILRWVAIVDPDAGARVNLLVGPALGIH